MKILQLESLQAGYKRGKRSDPLFPPLDSFACRGELIALIGQNGIGKSTLIRTIAGLQEPLGGKVLVKSRPLKELGRYEIARTIGYISTEPVRVTNMTVYDLVSLGRYPHTGWTGKLQDADHLSVREAISKVSLDDFSGRYINELSDGERQRAMIARVLAQDAELLLMDEPTAFLDVTGRTEMVHLLHELTGLRGKTVIYSTHDIFTAISESDRIWLLLADSFREGRPEELVSDGSLKEILGKLAVSFTEEKVIFSAGRIKASGL